MFTRRLFLLIGVVLVALGIGIILYGTTLPPTFVDWFHARFWAGEVYIISLYGLPPLGIGIALLLYWFYSRSKSVNPSSC